MEKKCSVCKCRKNVSQFSKDKSRPDGASYRCKECDADYTKRRVHSEGQKESRRRHHRKSFTNSLFRAKCLIRGARGHAQRNSLPFDLTPEWIAEEIDKGRCSLSGLPFVLSTGSGTRVHPRSPSLDRIKAGGGYTKDNVRLVCWQANMARCQYGDDALIELAEGLIRTISSQGSAQAVQGSETIPSGSTPKRAEAHRNAHGV